MKFRYKLYYWLMKIAEYVKPKDKRPFATQMLWGMKIMLSDMIPNDKAFLIMPETDYITKYLEERGYSNTKRKE